MSFICPESLNEVNISFDEPDNILDELSKQNDLASKTVGVGLLEVIRHHFETIY